MRKIRYIIVHFPRLLRDSLGELLKNDPLRMAGATAFFTTFALPPILVILIQVLKLVIDPATVRTQLFENLSGIVGPETVNQIMGVLRSMRRLAQNWWIMIGGFIFLLFVATTLFKVIRNSLNQVWKMRPSRKQNFVRGLKGRAQSIAVILVAGILFVIGLAAETVQAFVGKYIFGISPLLSLYFNTVLNYIVSIVIVTAWFSIVFRYLPDGRPSWRIAFAGAFLTGILFTIGKIILHWLLSYSNITTLYGTSASIVLLLLFVFYSSLILYFGAAFTKVWGVFQDDPILPLPHAMHYRLIEAEVEQKKAEE
jgi:membrane protein